MGFEIKSLPKKEVEGSGVFCSWNALHNPIIFEFERKDFIIASVTNNGGQVRVTTLTPYGVDEVLAGDTITLFDDVYKKSVLVTNVVSNTVFDVDLDYSSGASGYIILNKRKNYYLSSQIQWNNPTTNTFETIATSINQPDMANIIKVNSAPFLKKKVNTIDDFNYSGLNNRRTNYSGKFSLIVTEYFDNASGQVVTSSTIGNFFYVNSARQIQQKYGSNLAENFMIEVDPFTPAKFLSAFAKPTYFKNFPFCLNWIYNDVTADADFTQEHEVYYNDGSVNGYSTGLDYSKEGYLNASKILVDDVNLVNALLIRTFLYNNNGGIILTENFDVDFDSKCHDNPVFLNWLGTNGSRNFWLFDALQTIGIDVQLNASYEKYIDDLETSQGSIVDLERTARPTIALGGMIPIDKIEGLKSLLYSIDVLMLVNPTTWQTEGVKWQKVRVVPASFKLYDTDQITAEFQLTIQLDNINIQIQ